RPARVAGRQGALPLSAGRCDARCAHRTRRPREDRGRRMNEVVVEAKALRQVYKIKRGMFREPAQLQAVGGISFAIEAGRTLAVVGESGCGKSTLARMVALIEKPAAGELTLVGIDAVNAPASEKRRLRQAVQFVF